ncbi:adenylate/guanylate cyclase domain-containing protein [Candidatus Latescibacterota bacterium]
MPPRAHGGVLDLSNWDLTNRIVRLDGEWELYWQQLLVPGQVGSSAAAAPMPARVPGPWNGLQADGEALGGHGYGTYRLRVKLGGQRGRYALKLLTMGTAHRLWLNGELVSANGVVATSPDGAVAEGRPRVVAFQLDGEDLELVVQVSNFAHRKGGIWESLELGSEARILDRREGQVTVALFLFGSLLIMAFYHFALYLMRRQETSALYFGLFCLLIALRVLATNERFLFSLAPGLSWGAALRLEYLSFYLAVPLFTMFIGELFGRELWRPVVQLAQGVGGAGALAVLALSTDAFSHTMVPYQVVTLLVCVGIVTALVVAVYRRRQGAIVALAGFAILATALVNDVLNYNQLITTAQVAPYGVFAFMFSQAILLSSRFATAFATVERQARELGEMYEATNRFVPHQFLGFLGRDSIVDVRAGDHVNATMSVLFADIRSFTEISEAMSPDDNFRFLNSYLEHMEPAIRKNAGFIDKYVGDAIMALFDHGPDDAVAAAIGMRHSLEEYNTGRHRAGYPELAIGIGVNSGHLMLGTVGDDERMESTVISHVVNVASRIERMTKRYGVALLISDNTWEGLTDPERYCIRRIDRVAAKGQAEPMTVYEVFDADDPELREAKKATASQFEEGIALFYEQRFEEAEERFSQCLAGNGRDGAARKHLERCQHYQRVGWDDSWDGFTRLEEK